MIDVAQDEKHGWHMKAPLVLTVDKRVMRSVVRGTHNFVQLNAESQHVTNDKHQDDGQQDGCGFFSVSLERLR